MTSSRIQRHIVHEVTPAVFAAALVVSSSFACFVAISVACSHVVFHTFVVFVAEAYDGQGEVVKADCGDLINSAKWLPWCRCLLCGHRLRVKVPQGVEGRPAIFWFVCISERP